MTPRQAYALAHPITDPSATDTAAYTAVRVHARGYLLQSVLAVDR